MKSVGINKNFADAKVDALATVVFKDEKVSDEFLKQLNELTAGQIKSVIASKEFKGEKGETVLLRFDAPKGKSGRLLLIGVGEKDDYKSQDVAVASGTATRTFRDLNYKSFAFSPRSNEDAVSAASASLQGAITSQFELDKYKTVDKNEKVVDSITVHVEGANPAELKQGLSRGEAIGESMNVTRDLSK